MRRRRPAECLRVRHRRPKPTAVLAALLTLAGETRMLGAPDLIASKDPTHA